MPVENEKASMAKAAAFVVLLNLLQVGLPDALKLCLFVIWISSYGLLSNCLYREVFVLQQINIDLHSF